MVRAILVARSTHGQGMARVATELIRSRQPACEMQTRHRPSGPNRCKRGCPTKRTARRVPIMSTAIRSFRVAGLIILPLLADARVVAKGADAEWARSEATKQTSNGNAVVTSRDAKNGTTPPIAPAPPSPDQSAANSSTITYRSYSSDNRVGAGYGSAYYYSPAPCGCYYSFPAQIAPGTAGPAAASQSAPSTPAARLDSGTYRSFSPDPGASARYWYYDPGVYRSSSSSRGHSWGGRR
jgi:hypothetical protein